MATYPRITIALCTYNGARHLEEQLESFQTQAFQTWDLWVSDDGSSDATMELLQAFEARQRGLRTVKIIQGPGKGAAVNYLSLLCHPDFPTDVPVALADQDDVWLPIKLERALAALADAAPVALYGARSMHTDAGLNITGMSILPQRPASFSNALTQNIISGHSATLSKDALAVVRKAGVPEGIPYHDWWLYQLISGAGGEVVTDHTPVVYYRQHGDNVMGAHQGLGAHIMRSRKILGRTYGTWLTANQNALWGVRDLLHPEQRALLKALREAPKAGPARVKALKQLDIYRQGRLGTSLFYLAALLGLT